MGCVLLRIHSFLLAIKTNEILIRLMFPIMVLRFLQLSSDSLKIFLQKRNFKTYTLPRKSYLSDCLGIPAMNIVNLVVEARLDAITEKNKREAAALTIS